MVRHSRIGLAMILALAGASISRAGYVTPDSIIAPVLSSPVEGSTVPAGGLVTNQYQGLGLLFPTQSFGDPASSYSTAVVALNNRDVFIPAAQWGTLPFRVDNASNFSPGGVTFNLVAPGTTTPDVADSVTVSLYSSGPIYAQLEAFDKNGQVLKTINVQVAGDSVTPFELDAVGMQSISTQVFQPVMDGPPPGVVLPKDYPYAWGVSSIEWHEAPEPAGFVLGGLGMIALLGYFWRRRLMRVHKMPA